MVEEGFVEVDLRALAHLRAQALNDQALISGLQHDLETTQSELDRLSSELDQMSELRTQLEDVRARERALQKNLAELEEGLRRAQAGYWDTTRELEACRMDLALSEARVVEREEEISAQAEQMKRITNSRAWKMIKRYRRVVNRMSSSAE